MENDNSFNGEIKITKGNINTKDDFILQVEKFYHKSVIEKKEPISVIILIKNYLSSIELEKLLINSSISYCTNTLTKINLTANNITEIPHSFLSLTNMTQLILNNNKISKIDNLSNMILLERLELRGNKIEVIENLQNNKNIKTLTLSSNLIKDINKDTFPKNDKLIELGLFGNFIGENSNEDNNNLILIDTIRLIGEHCPSLQSIYIGGNYISQNSTLKEIIKKYIKNIKTIDGHNI